MKNILIFSTLLLFVACGGSQSENISFGGMGTSGAIGGECQQDSDCNNGFCDRTVPEGYCSAMCDESSPCEAGSYCRTVDGQGFCMQTCTSPLACRDTRFLCYTVIPDELGVCAMNLEEITPIAPNIGAPCSATVECAAPNGLEAYCIPEISYVGTESGFLQGMCLGLGCSPENCGENAVCLPATTPYCVPRCENNEDCRDGFSCDLIQHACLPL